MTDTARNLGDVGLENFAPYLMNRIMGRYNAALHTQMAEQGLTTPKMRALGVLSARDGLLIRELAVYAVVEQSTLSRALDGLEADGLVERRADTGDGRAFRVFLTQDGRAAHERLWPTMQIANAEMFNSISDQDRTAFLGTLQTILRNIRKHDF